MKIAPIIEALKQHNQSRDYHKKKIEYRLIHTGQHYSAEMSDSFFRDLQLSPPDVYLGVGSGPHGEQTGKIMIEFERICQTEKPDLVVVVGDVNSTAACALTAAKMTIPVAHIEAGLRSYDRTMPEEINRILTDHVSDYLFTSCREGNRNLVEEGINRKKIYFVGNVMIDSLMQHISLAKSSGVLKSLGLIHNEKPVRYVVLTLHRPSNVDDPLSLKEILSATNEIAQEVPVVFPAHPRTALRIRTYGFEKMVVWRKKGLSAKEAISDRSVNVLPPLGYVDFLSLMSEAKLVLTDSGGIQEETTILGIPCLTLRDSTERPITVREGTNRIVGNNPDIIVKAAFEILNGGVPGKRIPELWDGQAAQRITRILTNQLI